MPRNKEATGYVITVAVILSLVCATLVSLTAIGLKPIQDVNAAKEKKLNILLAAGIYEAGDDVDAKFEQNIVATAIDLATGEPTDAVDAATFDAVKAAKNPNTGMVLSDDPAKIKYISKYATVYQYMVDGQVQKVILPIRGYGLWGTMYGFLAMQNDGKTVEGLTFYEHKETPGLGAEIANPDWQATWVGKKPFAGGTEPQMTMVKTVSTDPNAAQNQVDTLAGATLTSRGVENTVNFWLSDRAYGPFLKLLAAQR